MWKLIVGFIVFAALAMYVISKGGDSLDMSGEKHGSETHAPAAAPASEAASTAPAASAAVAAASEAAAPAASAASK